MILQKRCPNCNKLFGPRKLANGNPEPPSHFKKKVHCSQICGAIAAQARKMAEKQAGKPA